MAQYTIHTSSLFDPKLKKVRSNISITVDKTSGVIVKIYTRNDKKITMHDGDVDLREKFVMPGLVDAHTHIFLHSYE